MITNEQRAHDIALTLLQSRAKDLKPIEAYHEYVNSLLPIYLIMLIQLSIRIRAGITS